jgi:AraC family transcriptional regulator, positive regulator of tynA and feaB
MREMMHRSDGALNRKSEFAAESDLDRLLAEGLAPDAELSYFGIRSHQLISVSHLRGTTINLTGTGGGASAVILHSLVGGCRIAQDGRLAHLREGDCVLLSTARPLEIIALEECELFFVCVPLDCIDPGLAGLPITAVRIGLDEGVGGLVAGYLRTFANFATTVPLHLFGSLCRSAFSMALIGATDGSKARQPIGWSRQVALEKVKAFVGPRLNRKLTPKLVAAELGISIRYLHLIFKEEKATFSAWLWDQRLVACKSRLCDSKYERETVGAIALECGFLNFSHFSRRFRERFGISAKDLRRASMRNLAKSSAPNTARVSSRRIERLIR